MRNGIIHNWTMTVDPGCKNVERFSGDIGWYMMESTAFNSNIGFKLKNEYNDLVSLKRQSLHLMDRALNQLQKFNFV